MTKSAFARVDVLREPDCAEIGAVAASLHEAIGKLDIDGVRCALAVRPRLADVPGVEWTPVQLAVFHARQNPDVAAGIIRLLVGAGADVNAVGNKSEKLNNNDWPILMPYALAAPKHEPWAIPVVAALLDAGADVNKTSRDAWPTGQTALHLLAGTNDLASIRFLHDSGGDASLKNAKGKTPNQLAAASLKSWAKQTRMVGHAAFMAQLAAVTTYLDQAQREVRATEATADE